MVRYAQLGEPRAGVKEDWESATTGPQSVQGPHAFLCPQRPSPQSKRTLAKKKDENKGLPVEKKRHTEKEKNML
jgi:hypothetical protein